MYPTLTTDSLSCSWEEITRDKGTIIKIVLLDVDYTLINFDIAHKAGISALKKEYGGEFASEFNKIFSLILDGHRCSPDTEWDDRERYENVMKKVEDIQNVSSGFGFKVWSREAFIAIVSENLAMSFTQDEIIKARDIYWDSVTKNSVFYDDAQEFISFLEKEKIPVVLMVGSDAIMNVTKDERLCYDPIFSESYKKKRLQKLPIITKAIITGDPIDKPDKRFFERVFKHTTNYSNDEVLAAGDLEKVDLEIPRNRGYHTWLVRRR